MRSGERFTIVSSTLRRNYERAEVAQERCSLLVRVGVRGSNPDSVIKVCAAEFDSIERIFRKIAPKTRKLFNSLGRKVKMKVVYSFPVSRIVYFHTVHLFFSLLVWFFIRQNYFYDLKTRFWKRVTLNTEKFIKLEMIFFVRRRLDEKFEIFKI